MDNSVILKRKLYHNYSHIFEPNLIQDITEVGYLKKINNGHLMIDIGEELTHIPLIIDGIVKIIRKDKHGFELSIYYLEPGDTCAISFANCINKKKSIFKGIAESDVEAVFIPVGLVDKWLIQYESWRHFIIDSYHFRLLEMVETIDSLAFLKLENRIWKYLTDKVRIANNIDLEITHQKIAEDLNSTRVVITRIIKKLHDEEKIYSTRNKVKLLEYYQ
ncbi:Crp/Fnr family transcriptional regulator [Salinimicrobium soli]|uniref:Crp/Fnr family transcriptional regulator n=1 Tax=Salinimicrobium soli TaxID=1254399 RepID=UPI003AAC9170